MTTQSLVFVRNGQALTTSKLIADGVGIQHKNALELIRTYQADFEEFGRVAFQTRPFETAGGIQQKTVALLNEQQATLLITYCRNTEQVRKFKIALVKAFYETREQLHPTIARPLITNEQRIAIMSEVNRKACAAGVPRSDVYMSLKLFFKVEKFTDIPSDYFDLVIDFIKRLNYGNSPKALPAPESPRMLSETELEALQHLYVFSHDSYWKDSADQAYKVLQAANSSFAHRFFDFLHEPDWSWIRIRKILERNHIRYA